MWLRGLYADKHTCLVQGSVHSTFVTKHRTFFFCLTKQQILYLCVLGTRGTVQNETLFFGRVAETDWPFGFTCRCSHCCFRVWLFSKTPNQHSLWRKTPKTTIRTQCHCCCGCDCFEKSTELTQRGLYARTTCCFFRCGTQLQKLKFCVFLL